MSYSEERETFIAKMSGESIPLHVLRTLLARANTIQRNAVLSCSSEAADRDRVPCPGVKKEADCICDRYMCACGHSSLTHTPPYEGTCGQNCGCQKCNPQHESIPRIDRQTHRIEKQLIELLAKYGYKPECHGDPRGYCVTIKKLTKSESDRGIGVPTRNY